MYLADKRTILLVISCIIFVGAVFYTYAFITTNRGWSEGAQPNDVEHSYWLLPGDARIERLQRVERITGFLSSMEVIDELDHFAQVNFLDNGEIKHSIKLPKQVNFNQTFLVTEAAVNIDPVGLADLMQEDITLYNVNIDLTTDDLTATDYDIIDRLIIFAR